MAHRPPENTDPETLRQLSWDYLMYQDIHHLLSDEAVAGIEGYYTEKTRDTAQPSNVLRYAQALHDIIDDRGEATLHETATELTHQFMDYAERAELMQGLSPFSLSKSWAYWDIAKQRYFSEHREESCPECTVGDALRDVSMQQVIVNRHLGWEAYAQWNVHDGKRYQEGEDVSADLFNQWLARRKHFDTLAAQMDSSTRAEIEVLLDTEPKDALDTLSSHALARLGELLRVTVDAMQSAESPRSR